MLLGIFGTKGKAISDGSDKEVPLVSSNFIYEYGLASSVLINRELKKIFCFAPQRLAANQ